MKSKLLFLLFITSLLNQVRGQTSELQAFFDSYTNENHFNGNVLVVENGKTLFSKSYGWSNQEFQIPNNYNTKFRVASITKLFTSVLIYKLIEEGKLTIENTISEVLPTYSGEGAKIVTIYQLLTSTSGIQGLEEPKGDEVYEKRLTTDEVLQNYASGPLVYEPGTKFSYNNADYIILGKILESIHGNTFKTVLQEQILTPFNLEDTGVLDYQIVDKLATSYFWNNEETKFERDVPYYGENYAASGNMYSTVNDLNRFSEALYTGKIINDQLLNKLLETVDGVKDFDNYASGLWSFSFPIDNGKQHHGASRPGNIWGSECMLFRFIEKGTTMVILSNGMGTSDMWAILRKVQPILYN